MMSQDDNGGFGAVMAALVARFETALEASSARWHDWPDDLVAPTRHVLFGGGKRVRPMLAMLAAEAVRGDCASAIPWAIAIEMVHTYSLAHDDLPAMDDDDERRGRPTCHIAYGEAHAILTGDVLVTEAFGVLANADWPAERAIRLVGLLASASGGAGMVGGQIVDIGGRLDTLEALEAMQRLKTGALIRAAAEGGAIAADGTVEQIEALRMYGADLGLLFQITDDIIDRQQDDIDDGKNVLDVLDSSEAIVRRDQVAARAHERLASLGTAADPLRQLIDAVTHRSH